MNSLQEIAEMVAAAYGVSVKEMRGHSRRREYTNPRHVGMYVSKLATGRTYANIGTWYGGRDHSTVIYAQRQVESIVDLYYDEAQKITKILRLACEDIGEGAKGIVAPPSQEIYIVVNA